MSQSKSRSLLAAGIATSLIAALPVWVEMIRRPELVGTPRIIAWNALLLIFLAAFMGCGTAEARHRWRPPVHQALLLAQSLVALVMAWLELSTVDAVFLVIVAAQLRSAIALRPALVWVALQTAAYGALGLRDLGLAQAVTVAGAFGGFQLFALYTFHIAEGERQAREELARTHESLLATRQLLAESTRAAERLRISRELHDALGHHLTALTLNLEAALHAPDGEGRRHVETAQRLARDLLGDVRQVVGTLRREEVEATLAGRLAATLAGLGAGIEEPQVHLTVQPDVQIEDPGLEHALVRCAQEIFTNAVRHAGARNLWLAVAREGGDLVLRARDDGRGAAGIEPGHGLRGMRERVEEKGGRLDLSTAPGGGFTVTAWLPSGREGVA